MMQKLATFSLVVVLALMTMSAAEKKAKKEKPALQELSLVGKLEANVVADDADEKAKKMAKAKPYTLVLEDGTKVVLSAGSVKKNKVDLSVLVDKKITLKFLGLEKTKKDKTMYMVRTIVSAEAAEEGGAEDAE